MVDSSTPRRSAWPRVTLVLPPDARDTLHDLATAHYRDPKREALRLLLDAIERERIRTVQRQVTDRLEAALAELAAAIRAEIADAAPPTDAPPELLSIEEAARRLGIGRTAMYGLLTSGRVRSVRIGRRRLVGAAALAAVASA
jgi:excisionase family DNA binding protein